MRFTTAERELSINRIGSHNLLLWDVNRATINLSFR